MWPAKQQEKSAVCAPKVKIFGRCVCVSARLLGAPYACARAEAGIKDYNEFAS